MLTEDDRKGMPGCTELDLYAGGLPPDRTATTAQWVLNPAAGAFYEEAGSAAAALGVTVSIFAASARTCGLHAMQALAEGSGGCIRLYPSLQQAAIAQVILLTLMLLGRAEDKSHSQ